MPPDIIPSLVQHSTKGLVIMLPPQCYASVLNVNNPDNYHPIKTCWEVEAKRGFCWVYVGMHDCLGDLDAARKFRKLYRYKNWRVRESSSHGIGAGHWRYFRFFK